MDNTDWRISTILREVSANFEKQAKAVETLLNSAQEKFRRDYTATTAGVGISLISVSIYLALFGKSIPFATGALITGAVLLVSALVLRHKSADSQVRNGEKILALEQERARV